MVPQNTRPIRFDIVTDTQGPTNEADATSSREEILHLKSWCGSRGCRSPLRDLGASAAAATEG